MKGIKILYLFLIFFIGCGDGKHEKSHTPVLEKKKTAQNSPVINKDTLDVVISGYHIRAEKFDSLIQLKYKLIADSSYHHMYFRYFDFSEVAFPTYGVGLIRNNKYVREKVYIFNNRFLILPVIGINFYPSFYLIDLKKGIVLSDDVRTALDLIWIKNNKEPEIILANKTYISDTSHTYTFFICTISNGKIITKKEKPAVFSEDLRFRESEQFEFINSWLKLELFRKIFAAEKKHHSAE